MFNSGKYKYVGLVLAFMLASVFSFAQVFPNNFIEETAPDSSNFELYSQKNGLPRRANLNTLKKYFDQKIYLSNDSLYLTTAEGDTSVNLTNYLQTLSLSNDTLYLSNSNFIVLDSTNTDSQSLSISGDTLSVERGGSVLLSTFRQTVDSLYIAGTNLYISLEDDNVDAIGVDISSLVTSGGAGTATNIAFNGNRPILRVPQVGDNLGTDSIKQWLVYWYFSPPTISCNLTPTTTIYEVGTSNSITVSGVTTNPGGATLSGGELTRSVPSSNVVNAFGAAGTYLSAITFTPQQGGSGDYNELLYSFIADQDWSFGSESGNATSPTRTINGVYPVLYGMSAVDLSAASGTTVYTTLTKLVQGEGDKSLTFTGSGFIYLAIPTTWGDVDLSQIRDQNEFNVTASFTAYDITVSSTGLTNDWTNVNYKIYKLNTTTTTSGYEYDFVR